MRTLRHYSAAATCVVFGYILWELVELLQVPGEPKPEALPQLLTALVITAMAAYQFDKNHPQFMALIFAIGAIFQLPWHFKIFGAAPLVLLILQAIGQGKGPFAKRFSGDPPGLIDPNEKFLLFGSNFVFLIAQNVLWRNLPESIKPLSPEDSGYWLLLSLPIADATTWLVHESGHAFAGFLVGYKLVSVESYPLKLERAGGSLKLTIDWTWRRAGVYYGAPTRVSRLSLREAVVVAGGPAAGFFLVVACWGILDRTSGHVPAALFALVSVTASASLVASVVNLWPPGIFGQKVDGTVLWNWMKGAPEFARRIAFRGCSSSQITMIRPREWNREWVEALRLAADERDPAEMLVCSAIDRLDAQPLDSQARADFEKAMATIRAKPLPPEATNGEIRRDQWLLCVVDGVRPEQTIFDRISMDEESAECSIALFEACFAACDGDDITALQKLDQAALWQQANIDCGFEEELLADIRMFRAKIESGTFVSAPHPQTTEPQASPPERSG